MLTPMPSVKRRDRRSPVNSLGSRRNMRHACLMSLRKVSIRYSSRKAFIGSMRAARRAGSQLATSAHAIMTSGPATNATAIAEARSCRERWPRGRCRRGRARGRWRARSPTTFMQPSSTMRTTARRPAPSAHPDANFARALAHGVRDDAVQAHGREQHASAAHAPSTSRRCAAAASRSGLTTHAPSRRIGNWLSTARSRCAARGETRQCRERRARAASSPRSPGGTADRCTAAALPSATDTSVARDADDFDVLRAGECRQSLAERILPGPITRGERFVDDGDLWRSFAIGCRERPATHMGTRITSKYSGPTTLKSNSMSSPC